MKHWLRKVLQELQPFLDASLDEKYVYLRVPSSVVLKIQKHLPKKALSERFVTYSPLGDSISPSVSDFLEVAQDVIFFSLFIDSWSRFYIRGIAVDEEKAIPVLRKLLKSPTTPPYGVSYNNRTIFVWW